MVPNTGSCVLNARRVNSPPENILDLTENYRHENSGFPNISPSHSPLKIVAVRNEVRTILLIAQGKAEVVYLLAPHRDILRHASTDIYIVAYTIFVPINE